MSTKIPAIIHYCWYGNNVKSESIQKCMETWSKLEGYSIMEWNDENCNFNVNEFVKEAYKKKKWAFISDYFRLLKLYEYGGIYMDTDVKVFKSFDDLLDQDMFVGFIYDCSIGTSVIGAKPRHPFIKKILDEYENIILREDNKFEFKNGRKCDIKLANNNDLITFLMREHYPQLCLNNKYQELEGITVYPKEYFETGSMFFTRYSLHACEGSWIDRSGQDEGGLKKIIKRVICTMPIIHGEAIMKHIIYRKQLLELPFYQQYLNDKNK